MQVVNEFERIGDHADNLCDIAVARHEQGFDFSQQAWDELETVTSAVREILEMAIQGYIDRDPNLANSVEPLEEVIDILVEALKVRHSTACVQGSAPLNRPSLYRDSLQP